MNELETLVVYRRWRDTDTAIALFPELPSDIYGFYCDSYEQVGQHGGADYLGVIQATTPANIAESQELSDELTRIGYRLKPIKRASHKVHETRRKIARSFR